MALACRESRSGIRSRCRARFAHPRPCALRLGHRPGLAAHPPFCEPTGGHVISPEESCTGEYGLHHACAGTDLVLNRCGCSPTRPIPARPPPQWGHRVPLAGPRRWAKVAGSRPRRAQWGNGPGARRSSPRLPPGPPAPSAFALARPRHRPTCSPCVRHALPFLCPGGANS